MDGRTASVNRVVKSYDSCLFAQRERNGAIHIYRRVSPSAPMHFVFALTDNWQPDGQPCEWGLMVIQARLQAIDLWKDETVVDRVNRAHEKRWESDRRDFSNNVESFLYDFRRQFARATNDINTSSLDKTDRRALKGA